MSSVSMLVEMAMLLRMRRHLGDFGVERNRRRQVDKKTQVGEIGEIKVKIVSPTK